MSDSRFQVLAIDGGGVRGLFAAALLAGLEEDLRRPIVEVFDLVVGTSTGGIVALGLGAGLSPAEIVDFYVTLKDAIFNNPMGWRKVRQLFVAKYRSAPLEASLRGVFGDTLLGESRLPLVIPSYNLGENDVYLLKTPHNERLRRDHKLPMWQVAMATTAAPTFFPAFRLPGSHVRLVDGGVWANNPAMVGVTEAVSMFGHPLRKIRVLSVGTTTTQRTRQSKLDNAGLIRWVRSPNVVEVLLNGQSTGAFTQVQHLVGADHARRLNPPAPEELAELDDCDASDLIAKAAYHSRIFCPDFDAVFGAHVPDPYLPFYGPNARQEAHGLSR
ncbi:MAG TPA: CBASS cGAMP-activated phospholipase [Acidimicrobiales bacterium]|nr:CBASS cGAMP-activated phospholipase [Acidimicrobiales bacterium]